MLGLIGDNLESPNNVTCIFLDGGMKPEHPERTPAYTGSTCKLQTERHQQRIWTRNPLAGENGTFFCLSSYFSIWCKCHTIRVNRWLDFKIPCWQTVDICVSSPPFTPVALCRALIIWCFGSHDKLADSCWNFWRWISSVFHLRATQLILIIFAKAVQLTILYTIFTQGSEIPAHTHGDEQTLICALIQKEKICYMLTHLNTILNTSLSLFLAYWSTQLCSPKAQSTSVHALHAWLT